MKNICFDKMGINTNTDRKNMIGYSQFISKSKIASVCGG